MMMRVKEIFLFFLLILIEIDQFEKSLFYYEKTLMLGNQEVIYDIASCYHQLNRIDKAIDFYQRASQNGLSDAFYQLGLIYERGEQVEIDLEKSIKLYQSASKNKSHPDSLKRLFFIFDKNGDFEKSASLLFEICHLKNVFKELVAYFKKKPVNWQTKYHQHWPLEIDGKSTIRIVLLISKYRKESLFLSVKSGLVKGVAMKIVNYLCHLKQKKHF